MQSTEAAFKYVVTGGISSALILFGMSYLYGITGATNLGAIAQGIKEHGIDFPAILYVAFFFLIAGLGIKIAAAPFHYWAADVYQGAPTPITAFLAVVSKGAAFAVIFRIIYNTAFFASSPGKPVTNDVFLVLLILAAAAMLIGSTMALRQFNAKRLMALSGVANAGYMLVPVGLSIKGMHASGFGEFVFYLAAYLLMTIGALAVVGVIGKSEGNDDVGASRACTTGRRGRRSRWSCFSYPWPDCRLRADSSGSCSSCWARCNPKTIGSPPSWSRAASSRIISTSA